MSDRRLLVVVAALFAFALFGVVHADHHLKDEDHAVAEATVEEHGGEKPHAEEAGAHGAVEHGDDEHAAEEHAAADAHANEGAHGATGDHGDGHEPGHNEFDAATHGNAPAGQNDPAEWKSELAIWTAVVFGCLTAILWKFAWGPIRDALDARERSVQQNIDAAKEQNDKAAALLADHEAKLAGTADEVRKILDDARKEAETQKQGILAEAEAAAESQKTRAIQEIAAAKNGALQELAEKSVDTAVGLAGKIVQRQLSPGDHSSLIEEAIKHFPSKN